MEKIARYFPLAHGMPRVDDHRVLSEMVYMIRNRIQWKDAPEVYGHVRPYTTASSAGAVRKHVRKAERLATCCNQIRLVQSYIHVCHSDRGKFLLSQIMNPEPSQRTDPAGEACSCRCGISTGRVSLHLRKQAEWAPDWPIGSSVSH